MTSSGQQVQSPSAHACIAIVNRNGLTLQRLDAIRRVARSCRAPIVAVLEGGCADSAVRFPVDRLRYAADTVSREGLQVGLASAATHSFARSMPKAMFRAGLSSRFPAQQQYYICPFSRRNSSFAAWASGGVSFETQDVYGDGRGFGRRRPKKASSRCSVAARAVFHCARRW